MISASEISRLIQTEDGQRQVVRMMEEAKVEIDIVCKQALGYPLTDNLHRVPQWKAMQYIAQGWNMKNRDETKERKPYAD